jgi:hypothetical protein
MYRRHIEATQATVQLTIDIHSQVRVLCTHILNYAHKADSAPLSDVVFPAAEDEGGGNHDVQIEVVGYCTGTSRYLKQIAMSSRSGVLNDT